jgi:1-acyl-sn-glycerol-3-phosphate acyltransferase
MSSSDSGEARVASAPAGQSPRHAESRRGVLGPDRSWPARAWYRLVQQVCIQVASIQGGVRATGRENVPSRGGVLLISNHLSHLDVFLLGLLLPRMLNYVARSTLFTPWLAPLIRSVGGFPIQRDGTGAAGLKETLKRLRAGGIVTFFPEGTRSRDGELGSLKPGIAALAARAGVPIVPTGIAGTFEAWPRSRRLPRLHPLRVHYGQAIVPGDLEGLSPEVVIRLLEERLRESIGAARRGLAGDMALGRLSEVPSRDAARRRESEVGGSSRFR